MSPFKTLLTVLALTVLGLGAAISLYSLLGGDRQSRQLDLVPVSISDLRITIPLTFFRGGNAPGSVSERADVVFLFPDMLAAGLPPERTEQAPDPRLLVFASIQANDGVLDPADRVQGLYGRFLEPGTFESPGGLLMKRFMADSPYGDEELFLAPPDGRGFSARCRKKDKATPSGAVGEACLWRFRQSGADFHIRFAPELLPKWETMAIGLATRLKEWENR